MNSTLRATRFAAATAVSLAMLLGATNALAFRMIQNTSPGRTSSGFLVTCDDPGGFVHWTNAAISWRLNTANQGSGKTTAVQNAMASWTNVTPATHSLTYAGTTTASFVTDGVNALLWANGNGCTGNCLAITALVLASGQVITETDVSFNNAVSWNTNGSDYDTEAIAAHELGHTLGIHHTNVKKPQNRPTMYAYYFGTAGRSLEQDDIDALNCAYNRYPPARALPSVPEARLAVAPSAETGLALSSRPREGGALIRYALKQDADVKLQVFDIAGRHIATLVEGRKAAGEHELAWDGTGGSGRVASGIYFARLVTPEGQKRATVILAE